MPKSAKCRRRACQALLAALLCLGVLMALGGHDLAGHHHEHERHDATAVLKLECLGAQRFQGELAQVAPLLSACLPPALALPAPVPVRLGVLSSDAPPPPRGTRPPQDSPRPPPSLLS